MPLPIPQQVLAQPVTSYYKGKAIRQELATAKKEEELLDLQIDAARNPKADPKEARDASLFLRDAVAEAGAAAVLQAREGASPEDVTAAFDGTLVKSGLPEEALAEIKKGYDRNGDGLLGEAELAELEAFSIARGQELQGGDANAQQTEFIGDDGQAHVGTYNPNTETYTDAAGTEHKNAKPIAGAATQEELTGDSTLNREIVKSEVATRNLVGLVDRTIEQIDNISQAGMGLTGKVMRGIDEVSAEVQGIATALGGTEWVGDQEVPAGSLLDYRMYEWTGELANASAAIKSNIITLSYLKARSMEPAGRLAKDDVALARQSLGGDYASKGKVKAALNETVWQALNGMKNYYRATGNIGKFPTDLNDRMADLSAEIQKTEVANKAADLPVVKTDADFDNLKVGDKFVDENGKVYTKDKD